MVCVGRIQYIFVLLLWFLPLLLGWCCCLVVLLLLLLMVTQIETTTLMYTNSYFDEYFDFIGSSSGILISPTDVLTAGHVTQEGLHALVTFTSNLTLTIFPDDYIYGYQHSYLQYQ